MLGQKTIEFRSSDYSTSEVSETRLPPATTSQSAIGDLTDCRDMFLSGLTTSSMLRSFAELSNITGGYVKLEKEFGYMPALIGSDGQPVFLYRIIEAIDEYLDINKIQEDFPNLNYSQIAGSIYFMRKVAQVNARNIDVDDLEDEFENHNPDFLNNLEQAFNDKETVRVFTQPE